MGGMPPQQQGPAPHVNPAFFNQGGPPQHQMHPHVAPPVQMGQPPNIQSHGPPSHGYNQPSMDAQRSQWPPAGPPKPNSGPPVPFVEQIAVPQISETEFEEIMGRNRTVSSSAIARAVSDAAAGEYSSAIETLVTAISLIKQSKASLFLFE